MEHYHNNCNTVMLIFRSNVMTLLEVTNASASHPFTPKLKQPSVLMLMNVQLEQLHVQPTASVSTRRRVICVTALKATEW